MKIVVLVKEVPDTYGERKLNLETGLADRAATDVVLDEIGERAVEVGLAYADKNPGTEVVALSMSPDSANGSLRKALAMGASKILHVADEGLAGSDLAQTAEVLASAIKREGFDLVIAGNLSTDGNAGLIPAMIAEHLGLPYASGLVSVDLEADKVSGTRVSDEGTMLVTAGLPAVISVTEQLPEGRFTSFKGIMAAKKKPYETLTAGDLGIEPGRIDVPRSIMTIVAEKPPRAAGIKIVDEGDAGTRLAEFLIQNRLA